jgi:MoaA/NifB/PqqE/SkfB family radical SAM enzyme
MVSVLKNDSVSAGTITKRIDAVTHIPKAALTAYPPCPRSVKIELTARCNYRCGFCALRMRKEQPKSDMEFELFQRITCEMQRAGVQEIGIFYLGETLMAPELAIRAVEHVKQIGIPYVFLTTNGSLCSAPVVEGLMKAGLNSLKFSMNASDEEQFSEIVQVKSSLFRQSIENLKTAHKIREDRGYSTRLYASSILYDGEQKKRMETLVEEITPYVDEHYWLPLYSMGSVATQREEELGYRPTAGNQGRIGNLVAPIPCWSVFTEGHVRSDGTFSLCCFDADGRFTVGDLKQDSFMAVWHSEAFAKVRRAHMKKDVTGTVCEDCIAYR